LKACTRCNNRFPDSATFCLFDGAPLAAPSDPRLGTAIAGRYLLEEVIGEGGMAMVYRARHKLVDAQFAVKVMNPLLARDPVVRERFRREAASAKKIAHPNIIEIFEEGDTGDGTAYMVMEYLEGCSLADELARGAIETKRALPLMIHMARGIARAHDLGVIHRDLKPENIFICKKDDEELIKLLDFGIALSRQDSRLTGTGELFGTPQYMAPERITSMDAGPAADLYSLGIIFYEMIAGKLPFDAPDIASFFVRHLKEPPAPIRKAVPNIPESLAELIEQLLAKEPKHRPVDAHKVTSELVAIAQEIGARVPQEPSADPTSLRGTALPVSTKGVQRWARRASLFREMLAAMYGGAPPKPQALLVEQLEGLASRVGELKEKSVVEQRKLEDIAQKGREGRSRLGFAVDALGVDASKAREDVRVAEEGDAVAKKRSEEAPALLIAAVREITYWEGRSGMQEPTRDLAKAYRDAAEVVDRWMDQKDAQRRAEATLEKQRQALRDLDYQIAQLRESVAKHEGEIEQQRSECERIVSRMSKEIDQGESELLELATRFCAPLRGKPELVPLFERLEAA
jgi:eukaryotic-like serine/threonine-protein kinase